MSSASRRLADGIDAALELSVPKLNVTVIRPLQPSELSELFEATLPIDSPKLMQSGLLLATDPALAEPLASYRPVRLNRSPRLFLGLRRARPQPHLVLMLSGGPEGFRTGRAELLRMLHDGRAAAEEGHPPPVGVASAHGEVLLYYPYFDSTPLETLSQTPLHKSLALRWGRSLLRSVGRIHSLGRAHGFLGPDTVLVDRGGKVQILGQGVDRNLVGSERRRDAGRTADQRHMQHLLRKLGLDAAAEAVVHSIEDALHCLTQRDLTTVARIRLPPPVPVDSNGTELERTESDISADVCIDGFEVRRQIGSGGFAQIYEAYGRAVGPCVLKILRSEFLGDQATQRRLVREAAYLATLTHANIVQLLSYGRSEDGHVFLALERVAGESLACRLKSRSYRPDEIRRTLRDVARGLAHAHARGIVHRDLHPGNIIVSDRGRAKIVDFGIARSSIRQSDKITCDSQVLGSPAYLAPEQIEGPEVIAASDIYALGQVLFYMLTGESPPVRHAEDPLKSLPESIRRDPLAHLMSTMLQRDANRRPTAEVIAKELSLTTTCKTSAFARSEAKTPLRRPSSLKAILASAFMGILLGIVIARPAPKLEQASPAHSHSGVFEAKQLARNSFDNP